MIKQNRNKVLFIIIIILLSVLFGINLKSNFPDTLSYFSIPFSDLLNIVSTLIIGVFVALYIGNRISDNSKLKEIRFEGLKKFEDQFDKIYEYFDRRLSKKDNSAGKKITSLFDNIITLLENFLEVSSEVKENKKYHQSIKSIYIEVGRLWELITSDPLNDLNKDYDNLVIEEIFSIKHSISTKIHVSKVSIYT